MSLEGRLKNHLMSRHDPGALPARRRRNQPPHSGHWKASGPTMRFRSLAQLRLLERQRFRLRHLSQL